MKKKFKSISALFLAMLIVFSLVGCGSDTSTTDTGDTDAESTDTGSTSDTESGDTVVIRVNSAFNSATVDETANGIAALEFVDKVAERTNGKYEIKLLGKSEALTNPFKWNVDGTQTDNAIYRDVVEILSNDKDNFDDIEFEGDITDIPVELYHKDGVLRVTVAQDLLPENVRSKAVKAELTVGNVPEQMYLKGSSSPDNDEVYCEGTQSLTKPFEGIDFSSGDVELEIHSLPQYPISEAATTGGISCKVRLLDGAGKELASNSFDSNADVYIYPNTISNVRLTKTGFEFGIDLEDDVWDGPNAANNLN